MATLADVAQAVKDLETEATAARGLLTQLIAVVTDLEAKLNAAMTGNDPQTLQALVQSLGADKSALQAAEAEMTASIQSANPPSAEPAPAPAPTTSSTTPSP